MCHGLRGFFFFFNDTATTEIYTLSLHDALPISAGHIVGRDLRPATRDVVDDGEHAVRAPGRESRRAAVRPRPGRRRRRSEEHTSELQSRQYLVCRLLLEKKNILRPS